MEAIRGFVLGLVFILALSVSAFAIPTVIIKTNTVNLSNVTILVNVPNLPADNVSTGTFGANTGGGDYRFPRNLTVDGFINVSGVNGNSTIKGDIQVNGTIYGGSPVKISGGLTVTGNGIFNDIVVTSCAGCGNGTVVNASQVGSGSFQNATYVFPNNLTVGNITVRDNLSLLALPYQCTGDNTLDIIDGIVKCGSDQKGNNGTVTFIRPGIGIVVQPNPITIEGNVTIDEIYFNSTFARQNGTVFFEYINVSTTVNASFILGNLSGAAFPASACPVGFVANGLSIFGLVTCIPQANLSIVVSMNNVTNLVSSLIEINSSINNSNLTFIFPIVRINQTVSFDNTSLSNLDIREASNNRSLTDLINNVSVNQTANLTFFFPLVRIGNNVTFDNTSLANLDARQRADNQSVARTNANNTFVGDQSIIGDLNVSGFVNLSFLFGNLSTGTFPGSTCPGSSVASGISITGVVTCVNVSSTATTNLPASNITNEGAFGINYGNFSYLFPVDLNVTRNLTVANISALDSISLRSKTSNNTAVLGYTSGGLLFLNQSSTSGFMYYMPNSLNPQFIAGNATGNGQWFIDMRGSRPICLNCLQTGQVETGGRLLVDMEANVTQNLTVGSANNGKIYTISNAPAVTACGTGAAVDAASTSVSGRVTVGSTLLQATCTLTFDRPWIPNAPSCVANDETTIINVRAVGTTTTVVISTAAIGGFPNDVLNWICLGYV